MPIALARAHGNARAGLASFGAQVVITDSVLTCNAIDMVGEATETVELSFDGSTGMQCSAAPPEECDVTDECQVQTGGSEAPAPAEPLL